MGKHNNLTRKENEALLTLAGAVKLRLAAKFTVSDFFTVNFKKNAPVKISYVGNNFKECFFSQRTSVSEAIPPGDGPYRTPGEKNGTLHYHVLNRGSLDQLIIAELGGEAKAETNLAEVVALIQKQGSGEEGALLSNGYANIFYVRDTNGVLHAVSVHWDGVGWSVGADSVRIPNGWGAGRRVFSRDS